MRDAERQAADEWTATEQDRLDALPRTRVPSDSLRTRTMAELRARRLVRQDAAATLPRAIWIAIAASLVFAAGGLVGYRFAVTRLEAQARLATMAESSTSANAGHVVWF